MWLILNLELKEVVGKRPNSFMKCPECHNVDLLKNKVTKLFECYFCGGRFVVEDGELVNSEEIDLSDLATDKFFNDRLNYGFDLILGNDD